MQSVADIRIADFDYDLPDERVPRHPLAQRDACRLLVSAPDGAITHRRFADLPELLAPGSLLVCNNTRVINARIRFRKPTGAEIETFLLEPEAPSDYARALAAEEKCVWRCLVGGLKRWKTDSLSRSLDEERDSPVLTARRLGSPGADGSMPVEFSWTPAGIPFADIVQRAGFIPIPPYLKRESEAVDSADYQTLYSKVEGSVAAPTAGLHFTPELFDRLAAAGISTAELTLHVGAGTFRPVKADTIGAHAMHTESFVVSRDVLTALIDALSERRPVVAVGTTSVRTLESLPYLGLHVMRGGEPLHVAQWEPYAAGEEQFPTLDALRALGAYMDSRDMDSLEASTAIMIAPGFEWRIVSRMITNFHQPHSTLLLLVSAFLDRADTDSPQWRRIYAEALREEYRFLSYGDACLLSPLGAPALIP